MSKQKILYVITQSELGGAQKYIFDLAYAFKDKYQVFVAFGEQGDTGFLAKRLKEKNISYFVIKNLKREISIKDDFKAFWELKKIINYIKPDVIHLNSSKISILGSIAAKLEKVPKIIYTAHGWVFNEDLPQTTLNKYKKLERFTAKFKDKIICVSKFDYKTALKEKICDEKKLLLIHNGIEKIQYFSRQSAREKLKKIVNLNIEESTILIGSIGNLYPNKGYHFLINAFKLIVDKKIDVKLIIIGDGLQRKELLNEIEQLNLSRHIFITRQIKEASSLLKAFDVYVCSSIKEGLSYTIIEAMQAQLPIVATAVGGNGELIGKEKEGLLVPSHDVKSLASAIFALIENKEQAKIFAKNAEKKALAEFNLEKMIKETEAISF